MDLQAFQQELDRICKKVTNAGKTTECSSECTRFCEVLQQVLKNENTNFEDRVKALTKALGSYSVIRPSFEQWDIPANSLGHSIFMECARVILGVDLPQITDEEEPRSSFCRAIRDVFASLQAYTVGQSFLVLQFLLTNNWGHPVLVSMMNGDQVEEEKALAYLLSGEYPELFKLRIEMLLENQCDVLAQNLCSWCVRSPVFSADLYVWQTNLSLLQKLDKQDEFVNQCMDLSCCLAVQILDKWLADTDDVKGAAHLDLSQSALLRYWVQSADECCTRPLLKHWTVAQRRESEDFDEIENSLKKLLQLAKEAKNICIMVQVVMEQFGERFQEFCTTALLQCLRKDRQMLDSAKIKHDLREVEYAADGLARYCRILAVLYEDHPQLCLGSLLTAFYLEPKEDLYHEIQSTVKQLAFPPPLEPRSPPGIDPDLYHDIFEMVQFLRPNSFALDSKYKQLRKLLILHMEESGYKYVPKANTFRKEEEAPPTVIREKKQKVNAKKKWKPIKIVDSAKKEKESVSSTETSSVVTSSSSVSTVSTESVSGASTSGAMINQPKSHMVPQTTSVSASSASSAVQTSSTVPSNIAYNVAHSMAHTVGQHAIGTVAPQGVAPTLHSSQTVTSPALHQSMSAMNLGSVNLSQPLSVVTGLTGIASDHSYSSPKSHSSSSSTPQNPTVPQQRTAAVSHVSNTLRGIPGVQALTATYMQQKQLAPKQVAPKPAANFHGQNFQSEHQRTIVAAIPVCQGSTSNTTRYSSYGNTVRKQLDAAKNLQNQCPSNQQQKSAYASNQQIQAQQKSAYQSNQPQQKSAYPSNQPQQKSAYQSNQSQPKSVQQQLGAQKSAAQPQWGSGQVYQTVQSIAPTPTLQTAGQVSYLAADGTTVLQADSVNTFLLGGGSNEVAATALGGNVAYVMPGMSGAYVQDTSAQPYLDQLSAPQPNLNQFGIQQGQSQAPQVAVQNVGTSSYSSLQQSMVDANNTVQQITSQVRQLTTLPVLSTDEIQQVLDSNLPVAAVKSPPVKKADDTAVKHIQYFLQSDSLPAPIASARISSAGTLYSIQPSSHAMSVKAPPARSILPRAQEQPRRVQYALQQRDVVFPNEMQPASIVDANSQVTTMTMKYLDENNQVKSTSVMTKPSVVQNYLHIPPSCAPTTVQVRQVPPAGIKPVPVQIQLPVQTQTQQTVQLQQVVTGQVLPPVTQQYVVQESGGVQSGIQQMSLNTSVQQATASTQLYAQPVITPGAAQHRPRILSNSKASAVSSSVGGQGQQGAESHRISQHPPAKASVHSQHHQQVQQKQHQQHVQQKQQIKQQLQLKLKQHELKQQQQQQLQSTHVSMQQQQQQQQRQQQQQQTTHVGMAQQQQQQQLQTTHVSISQQQRQQLQTTHASMPQQSTIHDVLNQQRPSTKSQNLFQPSTSTNLHQSTPEVQTASFAQSGTANQVQPNSPKDQRKKKPVTPSDCITQLIDQVIRDGRLANVSLDSMAKEVAQSHSSSALGPAQPLDSQQIMQRSTSSHMVTTTSTGLPSVAGSSESPSTPKRRGSSPRRERNSVGGSPRKYTSTEQLVELLDNVVERVVTGKLDVSESRHEVDPETVLTDEEWKQIFREEPGEQPSGAEKKYTSPEELAKVLNSVAETDLTAEQKEVIFGEEKEDESSTQDLKAKRKWTSLEDMSKVVDDVVERIRDENSTLLTDEEVEQIFGEENEGGKSDQIFTAPEMIDKVLDSVVNRFAIVGMQDSSNEESSSEEEVEVEVIIGPYFCKFCQAGFGTMAQRRRHQEWMCNRKTESEINQEDFEILACEFCGRELNTMSGLKAHYSRYHPELKHLVKLPDKPSAGKPRRRNSAKTEPKTEETCHLDRETRKKSQWYGECSSDSDSDGSDKEDIAEYTEPTTEDTTDDTTEMENEAPKEEAVESIGENAGEQTQLVTDDMDATTEDESASTELYEPMTSTEIESAVTSMDSEPASPVKATRRRKRLRSHIIESDTFSSSSDDDETSSDFGPNHLEDREGSLMPIPRSRSFSHNSTSTTMKKCYVRLRRLSATEVNAYAHGEVDSWAEKYQNCLCAFCGQNFSGLKKLQTHMEEHLASKTTASKEANTEDPMKDAKSVETPATKDASTEDELIKDALGVKMGSTETKDTQTEVAGPVEEKHHTEQGEQTQKDKSGKEETHTDETAETLMDGSRMQAEKVETLEGRPISTEGNSCIPCALGGNRPADPTLATTFPSSQVSPDAATLSQPGCVPVNNLVGPQVEVGSSPPTGRFKSMDFQKITFGNVQMYQTTKRICKACGASFKNQEEYDRHQTVHGAAHQCITSIQFRCVYCSSVVYKTMHACRHHMLYACAKKPKPGSVPVVAPNGFPCSHCKETYANLDYLQKHVKMRHPASIRAPLNHSTHAQNEVTPSQMPPSTNVLGMPVQQIVPSTGVADALQVSNADVKGVKLSEEKDANQSNEVVVTERNQFNHIGHDTTMTGNNKVTRPVPGRACGLDPDRRLCQYQTFFMYEVRVYQCVTCFIVFNSLNAAKRHTSSTCKGLQQVWRNQCYFCEATFTEKSECVNHQKQVCQKKTEEAKEKTAELFCPICRKPFLVTSILQQHLLKFHNKSASEAIELSESQKFSKDAQKGRTLAERELQRDPQKSGKRKKEIVPSEASVTAETFRSDAIESPVDKAEASECQTARLETTQSQDSNSKPQDPDDPSPEDKLQIPPKWEARLRKTRAIRRSDPLVLPSSKSSRLLKGRNGSMPIPTLAELVSDTFLKHCSKKWEEDNVQHFVCTYCGEEQRGLAGFHWHLMYTHTSRYVSLGEQTPSPSINPSVTEGTDADTEEDNVIFFKESTPEESVSDPKIARTEVTAGTPSDAETDEDHLISVKESTVSGYKRTLRNRTIPFSANNENTVTENGVQFTDNQADDDDSRMKRRAKRMKNREEELQSEKKPTREQTKDAAKCPTKHLTPERKKSLRKRATISYVETDTDHDFIMSPVREAALREARLKECSAGRTGPGLKTILAPDDELEHLARASSLTDESSAKKIGKVLVVSDDEMAHLGSPTPSASETMTPTEKPKKATEARTIPEEKVVRPAQNVLLVSDEEMSHLGPRTPSAPKTIKPVEKPKKATEANLNNADPWMESYEKFLNVSSPRTMEFNKDTPIQEGKVEPLNKGLAAEGVKNFSPVASENKQPNTRSVLRRSQPKDAVDGIDLDHGRDMKELQDGSHALEIPDGKCLPATEATSPKTSPESVPKRRGRKSAARVSPMGRKEVSTKGQSTKPAVRVKTLKTKSLEKARMTLSGKSVGPILSQRLRGRGRGTKSPVQHTDGKPATKADECPAKKSKSNADEGPTKRLTRQAKKEILAAKKAIENAGKRVTRGQLKRENSDDVVCVDGASESDSFLGQVELVYTHIGTVSEGTFDLSSLQGSDQLGFLSDGSGELSIEKSFSSDNSFCEASDRSFDVLQESFGDADVDGDCKPTARISNVVRKKKDRASKVKHLDTSNTETDHTSKDEATASAEQVGTSVGNTMDVEESEGQRGKTDSRPSEDPQEKEAEMSEIAKTAEVPTTVTPDETEDMGSITGGSSTEPATTKTIPHTTPLIGREHQNKESIAEQTGQMNEITWSQVEEATEPVADPSAECGSDTVEPVNTDVTMPEDSVKTCGSDQVEPVNTDGAMPEDSVKTCGSDQVEPVNTDGAMPEDSVKTCGSDQVEPVNTDGAMPEDSVKTCGSDQVEPVNTDGAMPEDSVKTCGSDQVEPVNTDGAMPEDSVKTCGSDQVEPVNTDGAMPEDSVKTCGSDQVEPVNTDVMMPEDFVKNDQVEPVKTDRQLSLKTCEDPSPEFGGDEPEPDNTDMMLDGDSAKTCEDGIDLEDRVLDKNNTQGESEGKMTASDQLEEPDQTTQSERRVMTPSQPEMQKERQAIAEDLSASMCGESVTTPKADAVCPQTIPLPVGSGKADVSTLRRVMTSGQPEMQKERHDIAEESSASMCAGSVPTNVVQPQTISLQVGSRKAEVSIKHTPTITILDVTPCIKEQATAKMDSKEEPQQQDEKLSDTLITHQQYTKENVEALGVGVGSSVKSTKLHSMDNTTEDQSGAPVDEVLLAEDEQEGTVASQLPGTEESPTEEQCGTSDNSDPQYDTCISPTSSTTSGRHASKSNLPQKFSCDHCESSFRQESSLECHLRWVHQIDNDKTPGVVEVKKFMCPICRPQQEFDRSADLQCHMKWMHCINSFNWADVVATDSDTADDEALPKPTNDGTSSDMAFGSMTSHERTSPVVISDDADADSEERPSLAEDISVKQHPEAADDVKKPEEDGVRKPDVESAQQKIKSETEGVPPKKTNPSQEGLSYYPWMCFICGASFIKRFQLAEHMRKFHAPDRETRLKVEKLHEEMLQESLFRPVKHHQWRCASCKAAYPSVGDWQVHMRDTHGHVSIGVNLEAGLSMESLWATPDVEDHLEVTVKAPNSPETTVESNESRQVSSSSAATSVQQTVAPSQFYPQPKPTTLKTFAWGEDKTKMLKNYSRVHKLHMAAKRKLESGKSGKVSKKMKDGSRKEDGIVKVKGVGSASVLKPLVVRLDTADSHIVAGPAETKHTHTPEQTHAASSNHSHPPESHVESIPNDAQKTDLVGELPQPQDISVKALKTEAVVSRPRSTIRHSNALHGVERSTRKRKHAQVIIGGKAKQQICGEPPRHHRTRTQTVIVDSEIEMSVTLTSDSESIPQDVSDKSVTVDLSAEQTQTTGETPVGKEHKEDSPFVAKSQHAASLPEQLPTRCTRSRSLEPRESRNRTRSKSSKDPGVNTDKSKAGALKPRHGLSRKRTDTVGGRLRQSRLSKDGVIETRSGRVTKQSALVMGVLKKTPQRTRTNHGCSSKGRRSK